MDDTTDDPIVAELRRRNAQVGDAIAKIECSMAEHEQALAELRTQKATVRAEAKRNSKVIAMLTGEVAAPKPKKPKKPKAPKAVGTLQCPECPRMLPNPQGLALHRKAAHGVKPGTGRAEADAPRPAPINTGVVLACGECEFEADNGNDLARHTMGTHGRRPTTEERTPVRRGAA